ncbi:MAG TPA: energy transducer TonB [Thermoanaerobaculia bacterium]
MPSARRPTTRFAVLATLLLLAHGAAAPAAAVAKEPGASAAELLAEARDHLDRGRYGKAAEAARRVEALDAPADAAAQASNLLGLSLYRHWALGLEDASEEKLKRLFGAPGRPTPPEPPSDELLIAAVEAFRRAVELDPDGGNAGRHNLAQALYALQRNEEAAAVIAEYVQRGGKHPEALALHTCLHPVDTGMLQRVEGEVARPEKIGGANPQYSGLARAFRVQGIVIMEAIIDQAGDVRCLRALKRLPLGLTEAAMSAVQDWKFKPATLGGNPVKVYYTLTVNFAIERRPGPG